MLIYKEIFNDKTDYNKKCLITNDREYSYKELLDTVTFISKKFKFNKNSKILTNLENSFESMALFLACSLSNSLIFPISSNSKKEKIFKIVDEYKINFFFCEDIIKIKKILNSNIKIFSKKDFIQKEKCYEAMKIIKNRKNYKYLVLFSSGSTGNAKPILFSQKNKIMRAKYQSKTYSIDNRDKLILPYGLDHSVGIRIMLISLINNCSLIMINNFNVENWFQNCRQFNVTFSMLISNHIRYVLDSKINLNILKKLKTIVSVSSLLENKTRRKFQKYNVNFHEMYGASEISTVSSIKHTKKMRYYGSVGKVLKFVNLKILKDKMITNKNNIQGEIICKTPLMFEMYYKNKKLTNSSFYKNYFRTGDIGYLKNKYLYFVGRKKSIIKISGLIVYPEDIENILLKSKYVRECAVKGQIDKKTGESAVAFIVGKEINEFHIFKHCIKYLESFQVPRKFIFLNELPKTSFGKIDKRLL